jgi:predicted DNA-binding transcriptional regulator AlpA
MNGLTRALEPNDRLIDARAVCDIVGARRRTALYRLIREDRFPTPIHIGRRSLWVESEVRQYATRKICESRATPARAAA